MDSILSIQNVLKQYHNHTAVNNVSFEVPKGKIFGLLGPNGAGKTSLIRIITSITKPDAGQILLDGNPIEARLPSAIGYMPEERGLYKKMKVAEQLIYLGRLKGLSKADCVKEMKMWFDKFDINDWWNKKIEELSKGMQQKIQFIATVLHKPKLLILDEPFSGLDPLNTNLIKEEIYRMHQNGVSIIFSTHRMEQVEEICESIVLINQGNVVLEGDVIDLKNQHKENVFEIQYAGNQPDFSNHPFEILKSEANKVWIKQDSDDLENKVIKLMIEQNVQIQSYREILPSLNEIFIKTVENSKA